MLFLHSHNQKTYENLVKLFRVHQRAVCVQPTGTGKSFIVLKLIEDNPDKKILITSPSVYIERQMKGYALRYQINMQNTSFITYTKLSQLKDDEISDIECDYIVLDEFHRCGAAQWGGGVSRLLENHADSCVLGTSATPIRYLDNNRNMAEELFNNVYASDMPLVKAINEGILPLPTYITAVYSFSGEVERLRIRAEKTRNPRLRLTLLNKIQQAKRQLAEADCGINQIFKKHIKNKSSKFIVFCPNIEKLGSVMAECDEWFADVNKKIHKYSVYYDNYHSKRELDNFADDNDGTALKLMFCVDMLNEGIHIDSVDGVIMLRATKSANVFYQQLGRALSCGAKHPVIFDIVNNYETGDAADIYSQIMELHRQNGRAYYNDLEFKIYDYTQDIRVILNELKASFENNWESVFDTLCEYIENNNRFPAQKEVYDGVRLGMWCSTQRKLYKSGSLLPERAEKLEGIGFSWADSSGWDTVIHRLKEFKSENGRLPKSSDKEESVRFLYRWLDYQKSRYKADKLSSDKIADLQHLGVKLTKEKRENLQSWEETLDEVKKYIEENNSPPKKDCMRLYTWLNTQKTKYKHGNLDEDKAEKLKAVGISLENVNNNYDWNEMLERLIKFKDINGRFPNSGDEDKQLYAWANMQKRSRKSGKLSADRVNRLDDIGFVWDLKQKIWDDTFKLLEEYIAENNQPPSRHITVGKTVLGQWYAKQIKLYSEGKLDAYRQKRLEALPIPLKKAGDIINEKFWNEKYNQVMDYVIQNKKLPNSKEADLYNWLIQQKRRQKEGLLKDEQIQMLKEINVIV